MLFKYKYKHNTLAKAASATNYSQISTIDAEFAYASAACTSPSTKCSDGQGRSGWLDFSV